MKPVFITNTYFSQISSNIVSVFLIVSFHPRRNIVFVFLPSKLHGLHILFVKISLFLQRRVNRTVQKRLTSRLISRKLVLKIYRTVILPVILYGCESWSTTLADKHKLRVFENKVLRKIYGLKRDEMTGQ